MKHLYSLPKCQEWPFVFRDRTVAMYLLVNMTFLLLRLMSGKVLCIIFI